MASEALKNIPDDVVRKLSPFVDDMALFKQAVRWRGDPPHGLPHIIECMFNLHWAWENLGDMDPLGFDLALRILRSHDRGYAFVQRGLIKPEEHHFGSMVLASVTDPDDRVMYGILHHVDDTLPVDAPQYVRVARDIDRMTAIGYTGVVRMAYYLGFRHDALTVEREEEFIKDGTLCEPSYPEIEEYEESAKNFLRGFVLPYFIPTMANPSSDKLRNLVAQLQRLRVRIYGLPEAGIEPVMKRIVEVFDNKIINTGKIEEGLLRSL